MFNWRDLRGNGGEELEMVSIFYLRYFVLKSREMR